MKIIRATNSGFFGCVFDTLRHIHNSQLAGESYYVNWGTESLYYDEAKGKNTWKNYFAEASDWQNASDAYEVSGYSAILEEGVEFRKVMNKLIIDHIHLNDEVQALWQRIQDNWMEGRILGVHMRYTDKFDWQTFNCPLESVPLDIPTWLKFVDKSLETGMDNIYLATDYEPAVDSFRRRYGSKLMYLKAPRSSSNATVHRDMMHVRGFEKGLTVLLDAYALSRCDHLLRSCSNVSSFAMFKNPELTQTNLNEVINGETSDHEFGLFST